MQAISRHSKQHRVGAWTFTPYKRLASYKQLTDISVTRSLSFYQHILIVLITTIVAVLATLAMSNVAFAIADAHEPNDSITAAKQISVGSTINANLEPDHGSSSAAYDYYKFTTTTAGPYTVEFKHATDIYDKDFASVSIQDSSTIYKGSKSAKLKDGITYIVADYLNAYTTYYVVVQAFSNDVGLRQNYNFVLKQGGYIEFTNVSDATVTSRLYFGTPLTPVSSVYVRSTKLVADRDYTLTPKTITTCGPHKITVTGKGNYYGSHTFTTIVYPSYPYLRYYASKALGKGKVKVSWFSSKGISNYTIYYKKSGANKWKSKTVKSSKTSLTISGLKKNKKYQFKMIAYKKVGSTKYYSSTINYSNYKATKKYSSTYTIKVK